MSESPSADEKPAKKRAAKKAAAKTVDIAATAAPVAKKAAKKAAKKVAKVAEQTTMNLVETPKKRAAKKAAIAKAEPVHEVAPPAAEAPVARPKKKAKAATAETTEPVKAAPAPQVEAKPVREAPQAQQQAPRPQHPQQQKPYAQQQRPQHDFKNKNQKFQNQNQNHNGPNKNQKFNKQKNKPFSKGPHPVQKFDPDADRNNAVLDGPKVEIEGLLEVTAKGNGFLRSLKKSFEIFKDDAYVSNALVSRYGLRPGVVIKGFTQMGPRGPQVCEIVSVNDAPPDEARRLPHFEELTAVNPTKRIPFENDQNRFTTRVLDIIAPVGRGQRGLIVSPPRSGKTTLMLHIAESVRNREDDNLHLIILLVDERPEEVTEFKRALPGAEIFASSNDEHPRNHCRIAELTIERAKRLVEAGKHVFLLMDSITRLARAYNNTGSTQGRGIGTGGVTVGALEIPRRLFAAARNTRGAGSLTILATALIQTNSRADEAIFQEFKGTGNMEIVLDRKIAENYIYPAVDIFKSGTRREELLLPEHMLHKIHLIRRGLSGHKPLEAMERLTYFLKKFPSNAQMLLEIKG